MVALGRCCIPDVPCARGDRLIASEQGVQLSREPAPNPCGELSEALAFALPDWQRLQVVSVKTQLSDEKQLGR